MTFSVPTALIVWTVIILVIMLIKKIIKFALIVLVLGYAAIFGCNYAVAHHYIDKNPLPTQIQHIQDKGGNSHDAKR